MHDFKKEYLNDKWKHCGSYGSTDVKANRESPVYIMEKVTKYGSMLNYSLSLIEVLESYETYSNKQVQNIGYEIRVSYLGREGLKVVFEGFINSKENWAAVAMAVGLHLNEHTND